MTVSITPLRPSASPAPIAGGIASLASDDAGSLVALVRSSANRGAATYVYDVASGATRVDEARTLALCPTGRRVVVLAEGRSVVRDLDAERIVPLPDAGACRVASARLGWDVDGDRVRVWDLERGVTTGAVARPPWRAAVPGAHAPAFAAEHALPDGRTLLWLDARFHLHVFDLEAGAERADVACGPREVPHALHVTHDGRLAVALGARGSVVAVDLERARVVARHDRLTSAQAPHLSSLLDDGRLVQEGRFLRVVDVLAGRVHEVGERDPNRELIRAIAALGGREVAVLIDRVRAGARSAEDRWIEIWDVDGARRLARADAAHATAPLCAARAGRLFVGLSVDVPGYLGVSSSWLGFEVAGIARGAAVLPDEPAPATKKAPAKKAPAKKPQR